MPNFKVEMKLNRRIKSQVFTAHDLADARKQAETRYPTAEILKVEQRGFGGAVQHPAAAGAPAKKGSALRKLILLVLIAALVAAGYYVLHSMGKV